MMYRFYLAAIDLLPGAMILIPIYFILNRIYFRSARKSILCFLFSCYLAAVYVLVGLPNVTYIRPEVNLNLIPIAGMIDDWKNSILNVLLFVPLGIMLPILWNRFKTQRKTLLFSFGVSLVIELLQMLTYRATDVNDLITNTLGAFLGFHCAKLFKKKDCLKSEDKTSEIIIVLGIVLLMMFFVYPFASPALWDWILL